jgi:hypothetical protein
LRESTTLLLACVVLLAIAPAALAFDTDGYKLATETILCDCGCHPQSVAACACGRAAEMREEMRGMVEGGMTGEAVEAGDTAPPALEADDPYVGKLRRELEDLQ